MVKKKDLTDEEKFQAILNGSNPAAKNAPKQTSSSGVSSTSQKGSGSKSASAMPKVSDADKFQAILNGTNPSADKKQSAKAARKEKWASFWKGVGKNVKAGATDSSLKNQAQYYAHNDPIKEKYRYNTVVNGKESTFTVDQSLNPDYHTSRFLDRALDPQHRVGRESNQGTIYTQEDANRDIQALDEYRARQDVRDYEADVATQQALQTIDPDTKVGQIAVAASMGVARTLPSLAKDAALTATTAGLLGAAGFGKTAIRLAKEIPTLTVRTLRYYDDAFQNALNNGATEEQAVRAAMQTALPNAAIESAGGLDALAGKIGMKAGMQTAKAASAAAKVGRQPWTAYVGKAAKVGANLSKVGFEEGAEEVAQGLIERGAARQNYDQNKLVWDINQIADDFGMGFMGGVIMGGAMKMAGGVVDATSKKQLAEDIRAEAAAKGVTVSDAEAEQIVDRVADAAAKSQTQTETEAEPVQQAPVAPQEQQQEVTQPVQQYEANENGETILPVAVEQQAQPVQQQPSSAPQKLTRVDALTEEERGAGSAMVQQQGPLTTIQTLYNKAQQEELTQAELAALIQAQEELPNDPASKQDMRAYIDALGKVSKLVNDYKNKPAETDNGIVDNGPTVGYNEQTKIDNGGLANDGAEEGAVGELYGGRLSTGLPGIEVATGLQEGRRNDTMGNGTWGAEGNAGRDVQNRDSEHRLIRSKDAKRLEGTAIKDNEGRPLAVYHFTPNMEFIIFENGDIGFHFGTKEQSAKRGIYKLDENGQPIKRGRAFRVHLNIKNPLVLNSDQLSWAAISAAHELWKNGVFTEAQFWEIHNLWPQGHGYADPAATRLREMLGEQGYDGIAYANEYENEGTSYIAFRDDQIIKTSTQDITFGEDGSAEWGQEQEFVDPQYIEAQPAAENAPEGLASAENGTQGEDFNIITPEGRGKEYTSEFRTNTVEKMLEQQQINQEQADELDSLFHRLPKDQLEGAAEDYVEAHNSDELLNYLQDKVGKGLNTLELAIAMQLRKQFQDEGKQEQAASAFQIVQNGAHMSGQMLQSIQLMAKVDPAFLQEDAKKNAEQQETKIHESRLQAVGVLGEAIAKADKGEWDGKIDVSKITPVSKGLGITANNPKVENGYIIDEGLSEKRVKKLQKQVAAIYENCKDTGISAVQWLSYLELELQAEGVATPMAGTSRMVASTMMLANMKTMLTRSLTGNTIQFLYHQVTDPISIAISNGLRSLYGVQGRRAYGGYGALAKGAKQGLATMKLAWLTDTLDVIGNKYNESIAENALSLNRMGGASEAFGWQVARFLTNCVHFTLGIGDQPFRRGVEAQINDQYERGNAKADIDFTGTGLPVTPKQQRAAMDIISKYGSNAAADFLIQAYTQGGSLSKVERMAAQMMLEASDIMQEQGAETAATYLVNDGKTDAKITSEDKLARIADLAARLEVLDDAKKEQLSELARGRNVSEDQQERAEYMGSEITFQNESTGYKLASGIRGLGRDILNWGIKEDNQAAKVTGRVLDTALHTAQPFVQVFGNQVSSVLEDTPLGAVVGLAEWASKGTGYVRGKPVTEKNVTDIANRISRGIVGGALLGLGMVLRGKGILSGEEPEDELEAAIWKQNGVIANSFKAGDKYYDISNIGPALVILNIGAAVYDQLHSGGVDELTTRNIIMTILGACGFYALEDVTSDQGWEGIMEKMEQLGEQDFTGMATDTFSNWLRQRYPQFLKQIADFRDPYKRDISAQNMWGEIKNEYTAGVPGRSENLPAKRDVLGREQERHLAKSTLGKVWESFFDPSQRRSKDLSNEPVLKELSDLARATDDKSLLLGNAPYRMDGYKLTGQERNRLQKTYNAGVADVITQLLQDDDYTNLSVEDKHTVIDNAETLLWYQARKQLADSSEGEYTIAENAAGKKMAEEANKAWDDQKIDLPTYLLYSMEMSKDYSLKYRPTDEIPVNKNGQPKGEVGDVIDSGKKKGAALAIKQQFGDDLTVDQMYYLWTLQSPSGDSAWKEVKNGGKDNDYYRYFANNRTEDELRGL